MTTKELVKWVLDAQDWHEQHWTEKQANRSFVFKMEALDATKPPRKGNIILGYPSNGEIAIAHILIREYWNDCQGWINEL